MARIGRGAVVPVTDPSGVTRWQEWTYGELLNHIRQDVVMDASIDLLPGSLLAAGQAQSQWAPLTAFFTGGGTGNWSNYGGGWPPLSYAIDLSGFVHLRGTVKNATAVAYPSTVNIATLPRSIWPSQSVRVQMAYFDTGTGHGIPYGYIDRTNGVITAGGLDLANNAANNGVWLPLWIDGMWIPGT